MSILIWEQPNLVEKLGCSQIKIDRKLIFFTHSSLKLECSTKWRNFCNSLLRIRLICNYILAFSWKYLWYSVATCYESNTKQNPKKTISCEGEYPSTYILCTMIKVNSLLLMYKMIWQEFCQFKMFCWENQSYSKSFACHPLGTVYLLRRSFFIDETATNSSIIGLLWHE